MNFTPLSPAARTDFFNPLQAQPSTPSAPSGPATVAFREASLRAAHAEKDLARPRFAPPARGAAALAQRLDDPQRQSSARERRRAEGRRAPGELRVDDGDHGRALFPCAGPERQGCGEAPC